MDFIKRNVIPSIVAFALLMLPLASYAQGQQGLRNPTTFDTIAAFIEGSLRALVSIALPVIAFFMVYAGFLFVKAGGSGDALTKAKKNFMWVVLGAALILGAWALATLIANTVSQLVRPS
jgi:hypothetical protein